MAPPKAALLLALLLAAPLLSSAIPVPQHDGPDPAQRGIFDKLPWFGGAPDGAGAGGGSGWGFFGGGGPGPGPRFGGAMPGSGSGSGTGSSSGFGFGGGGAVPPSVVCAEDGPCRGKRLSCPPGCFKTFSYKTEHGGGGGGGGGCSFDCTHTCAASC